MSKTFCFSNLAFLCALVLLCTLSGALHISRHQGSEAEEAQLNYLIEMQKNYKTQIIKLSEKIRLVSEDLNKADGLDEQVKILEKAINEERKIIGQLSTKIIPDPTNQALECQILSPEEQKDLTEKAQSLSQEIDELENLVLQVPYCDEIEAIKLQIEKMKSNLKLIERTVKNNCEQHFIQDSAVYQTNLYNNNNWILGDYTMEDLIDEYYQRNLQYANITNCPLQTPFYASHFPTEGITRCTACTKSEPFFNIEKKKCIACPFDFQINQTTHKCEHLPKNSNYTFGPNYVLDPLKLIPLPDPQLGSCPQDKPFFDGEVCVACQLPNNYWKISQKVCKSCAEGTAFNINMRKCVVKEDNKLTVLFGTKWVTQEKDIKGVLQERMDILQENKTSGIYQYCPELTPYYDDIACIYCPEETVFSLDTKLCTKIPEKLKYDPNARQFVQPLENYETDPQADNYISTQTLKDNSLIPNCNQTHPYYDSISCVSCSQPFPIFDVDTLRCSLCDPIEIYNPQTHKCDLREYIYVQGNEERLMATPAVSIQDYRQQLKDAVTENPDAIPMACTDESYYAGIQECSLCSQQKQEYFNVETKQCQTCDGTVDAETRICHERTYYLVNLESQNILLPSTITMEQAKKQINDQIQSDNQYKQCPIGKPIPINDQNDCSVCPETEPIYNYSNKICTSCLEDEKYDQRDYLCKKIKYLTDLQANVLIQEPLTISSLIDEEIQFNKTHMTEKCPQDKPYTFDHNFCLQCVDPSPIFNASSGLCTSCQSPLVFDSVKHICKKVYYLTDLTADGLLEQQSSIIPNIQTQQQKIKDDNTLSYEECPPEKPYGEITGCVDCIQEETYFNLKTLVCQKCPEGKGYWPKTHSCVNITRFSNLQANNTQYVQDSEHTIESLQEQISQASINGPVEFCPDDQPYFGTDENNATKHCHDCPEDKPFFILADQSCGTCNNYHPENQSCPPKPLRYPNLTNFNWITTSGNADKVINDGLAQRKLQNATECPAFYIYQTRDCVECPQDTYFNYQTNECETCPDGTIFDINIHICTIKEPQGRFYTNIDESESDFQLYGGLTINELNGTQQQLKQQYPDSHYCPQDQPYFDGIKCIKCPEYKIYFNLRYELCQVCLFEETLDTSSHNCMDKNGSPVWRKPQGKLVYPYLFGPK